MNKTIPLLLAFLLGGILAALALLQWIVFVTREPFRREHYSYMDLEYGNMDVPIEPPLPRYWMDTDYTWTWQGGKSQ